MKILEPGHIYQLGFLDIKDNLAMLPNNILTFVNREPGHEHPGTQTQEVIRTLIDRTYHCDNCMPSELNGPIIHHLRMALVYHEMRALERKAEKGYYNPESIVTAGDGHFLLNDIRLLTGEEDNVAPRREFTWKPDEKPCNFRKYKETSNAQTD